MNEKKTTPAMDVNDERLLSSVRPTDWTNPEPKPMYNLVVIGGGTAGLVTAIGAASLGAKVALVEKHLLGGDCLNYGCIPSKTLIRASRFVSTPQEGKEYGIEFNSHPEVNFRKVMEKVRKTRAEISVHDSAERVKKYGIDLFFGYASFKSGNEITVDGKTLRFKKCVLATGTKPRIPPIPGLEEVGYLTNETIFSLDRDQGDMTIIGGGPIGCELSQALRRLGWNVTLINRPARLLPREDEEASAILKDVFLKEGIRVLNGAKATKVERSKNRKIVHYETKTETGAVECDEILVSAGRIPNVENLNLEACGVEYDIEKGVRVDDFLRTTNRNVYAAGDVCLPYRFTHTADATARIVIRNALFFGRSRVSSLVIPWCTYTEPEIAHVRIAGDIPNDLPVIKIPLTHVDRAITDGSTNGFLKVWFAKKSGRIFKASLVDENAGDIIGSLTVAMAGGLKMGDISRTIFPYPTRAEILKKCADEFMRGKLTESLRKILETYFSILRK